MRVLVVISALLGALGVAAPAAAETAAQCHSALNQYRAKAGLDKASSSSIPALAVAAGRHAAYRVNVDPGDSVLLASLGLPDLGLFGPDLTAHTETPALTRSVSPAPTLGLTGRPSWPTALALPYEDVTTATGIPAARSRGSAAGSTPRTIACRCWTPTPATSAARPPSGGRRPPVCGRGAGDGRHRDATRRITGTRPPARAACRPRSTAARAPEPVRRHLRPGPPSQPVGYVVTLQADGYHAMKIQGIAFSKGKPRALRSPGRPRPTSKSTVASSAFDPNLPAKPPCCRQGPWTPTPPTTCAFGYVQAAKGKWVQFRTRAWSHSPPARSCLANGWSLLPVRWRFLH
jgi:hypothetical protein